MPTVPTKPSRGRVPWSVDDLRDILNGGVEDARAEESLRTPDRKGLNPVAFAALRAAATADSLMPLLGLLEPPPEGEGRLEQLLEAMEGMLDRLDRIEAKVDALSARGASTTSAPPGSSPRPRPKPTGGSAG